jgi:hypothetical protein
LVFTATEEQINTFGTDNMGVCGKENHRLLSYFSTLFDDSIIMHIGDSSSATTALSFNKKNKVLWFDFKNENKNSLEENVIYNTDNLFDDEIQEQYKVLILNTRFIYLSVAPHIGTIEYIFYEYLKKINYGGFIIFDEIWYHKEMRNNFWYKIPYEYRYDLTHLGHWTGTGVVTFNPKIVFPKYNNENWTMVTGYFNLTKCPDASNEIKNRSYEYYLSHAASTMSLPYNLVVYCDKESYVEIEKMRPSFLKDKTRYIIKEFDKLQIQKNGIQETFADYRKKINQNRVDHPYNFDPRNTASYYLFCMSRYLILKEVIETNPFNSTHFSWINFCIERMGFNNLVKLDEALALKRDKFSTCYINYMPKELVMDTSEYFKWGRCSMCSGFFTGNAEYMYKFCDLLENKFLHYLELGWGHSDETIYPTVYYDNPEIFEHYYGHYTEMITNYKYVHDRPTEPLYNFVACSFNHRNYEKCYEACKFVFKSYCLNKCEISDEYLNLLYHCYMNCKRILRDY